MKPRETADENVVSVMMDHTPFTSFVMDWLTGPSRELFALSFAVQMKVDKHALVKNLNDALPWLGIGVGLIMPFDC